MSSCASLPEREAARLLLGMASVLSPRRAAELLPWRDSEARRWLRAQGLILTVGGRELVIWGDVLEALRREADGPEDPPPTPRVAPLPRVKL